MNKQYPMSEKDLKFHQKRKQWIQEVVKTCEKHGETVEYEIDNMHFYLKVTCNHLEELDRLNKPI
jgi:hypothetical protein